MDHHSALFSEKKVQNDVQGALLFVEKQKDRREEGEDRECFLAC